MATINDSGFNYIDNATALKRMVNRCYEKFWRKRGMVPPANW